MESDARPPVMNMVPHGCLGMFVGAILGGLVTAALCTGEAGWRSGSLTWTVAARVAVVALPLYGALVLAYRRTKHPEMRAFLRMVLVATPTMAVVFFGLLLALVIVAGPGLGAHG